MSEQLRQAFMLDFRKRNAEERPFALDILLEFKDGKFYNPQVEREYEIFKAGSAALQEKVEQLLVSLRETSIQHHAHEQNYVLLHALVVEVPAEIDRILGLLSSPTNEQEGDAS